MLHLANLGFHGDLPRLSLELHVGDELFRKDTLRIKVKDIKELGERSIGILCLQQEASQVSNAP